MVTRLPDGIDTRPPTALVLRHLEDVHGACPIPTAVLDRAARQDPWFDVLPHPRDLPPEGAALVDGFRALPPTLRARLTALALRGEADALPGDDDAADAMAFLDATRNKRPRWISDLHRLAVLVGADPDDHRRAARASAADRPLPAGAALHLLRAGDPAEIEDLIAAADLFARADRPSWAVQSLIAAAAAAPDPIDAAVLGARAANIAAFEGDFHVAGRTLAQFTHTDTRTLIRESAPARALRQALVENDTAAARATLLARLGAEGLDPDAIGEALSLYALANIIDGDPGAWADFMTLSAAAPTPLHPEIAAIIASYDAPDVPSSAHLDGPVMSDGRGWVQLAGSVTSLLHEHRDMRLGSTSPSLELGLRAGNRLIRLVGATWAGVLLAHNQQWDELEEALRIARDASEVVPAPLLHANAETLRALAEAFRGEHASARERLDRIRAQPASRRAYRLRVVLDSVDVMIEGPQGDYEFALALLSMHEPDLLALTAGPYGPMEVFDFVDYALLLDRDEEAAERVAQVRSVLDGFRSDQADFVLAACDATLAARTTLAPTEALLARADSLPFVYETARLRLRYAEALRRRNRTAEARRQLVRVEIDLRSVRAGAWLDRVRRGLRACQREVSAAFADLTEQESRIAELAAAGLSNKAIGAQLYLSPRTVGGHLYKIFPKLGITTRAQLRDALAARAEHRP